MSTPYWGPDFDALATFDPEISGVVIDVVLAGAAVGLAILARQMTGQDRKRVGT